MLTRRRKQACDLRPVASDKEEELRLSDEVQTVSNFRSSLPHGIHHVTTEKQRDGWIPVRR
jgi:hypothetical protein